MIKRVIGPRFGGIIAKANKEEIPKPSLFVFSGRGFWVLWIIVGHGQLPAEGIWLNRVLYDRIERELAARCQSDPKSTDIPRVMRVPGSRNSKAGGAYVSYERYVGQNDQGQTFRYSLEYLAEFLGVNGPQLRPAKKGNATLNSEDTWRSGNTAIVLSTNCDGFGAGLLRRVVGITLASC